MLHPSLTRTLLITLSTMALTACSGDSGQNVKTSAPMPPITEMDAAMQGQTPMPQPLAQTDTLTPVMAQAPAGESVEERMARLEQTVNSLQNDYQRIMPAFASLNTTNERIQSLLDQIEQETGKRPVMPDDAPASARAAVAPQAASVTNTATVTTALAPAKMTPVLSAQTTTAAPHEGATPPPGAVVKKVDVAQTAAPAMMAMQETAPAAAVSAPSAPVMAATPAPSQEMRGSVTGVRIGEHGSKTRVVFDLTAKTKPEFKYDLDNRENLLLVDMPTSVWTGHDSGKPNSPLIAGWSAQKSEAGGATVAIQLKKEARILSTEFLKAEGKDPARLVMDIGSGG